MRKSLFLILSMLIPSLASFGSDNPCNEYYEAAIKFIVDTPVVHPFSVSTTTKVIFSPGNLQYQASTGTWRFAPNQYDMVGNGIGTGAMQANVYWDSLKADGTHVKVLSNNALASKSYGGWIDLFGWATSGHGKKAKDSLACNFYPWSTSTTTVNSTYNTYGYGPSYAARQRATLNPSMSNNIDKTSRLNRYFDWGYYNNIRAYSKCSHNSGGGDKHKRDSTMYFAGVWRTPTNDEWLYVLSTRRGVDNQTAAPPIALARIQYGDNARDTAVGLLVFPDDYRSAEVGVPRYAFEKFGVTSRQTVYSIDATTWEAMDEAGVVFLSFSGLLGSGGKTMYVIGENCRYWAASATDASQAQNAYANYVGEVRVNSYNRSGGRPVRLVQDIKD